MRPEIVECPLCSNLAVRRHRDRVTREKALIECILEDSGKISRAMRALASTSPGAFENLVRFRRPQDAPEFVIEALRGDINNRAFQELPRLLVLRLLLAVNDADGIADLIGDMPAFTPTSLFRRGDRRDTP